MNGAAARLLVGGALLLNPLAALDDAARAQVQAARVPALERVMAGVSSAANPRNVFAVLTVVAVAGGPEGPALVRELAVALLPTNLVVEVLKRVVDRTRPDGSRDPNNASFPSSHAANAFALAYVLARRWRRAGWLVWPLATLVAYSRMWLDRHYLSDVLAGVAIGLTAASGAVRWARGTGRAWVTSGRYGSG